MKDLSKYNIQCQEDYFMILDELEREEEQKMSDIRISQEEYKTLLTENAELNYLTATQKIEIERTENDLVKCEKEIEELRLSRFGE